MAISWFAIFSTLLTACGDPKMTYNFPPEYKHDWAISLYDCRNGTTPQEGLFSSSIDIPRDGIIMQSGAKLATTNKYMQMTMSGSSSEINSSEVLTGKGFKLDNGARNAGPCNYSYILLNASADRTALNEAIQDACMECRSHPIQ